MKLAIATHLDDSDTRVFASHARTGEWCVSGGFEFSNWSEGDLVGKARQAFSNGWLGLDTGGRATFVAVTPIETAEVERLTDQLAQHFVTYYGAPDTDAARPVAVEEITHMMELCCEHDDGTLLTVARGLTDAGVRESYRAIQPQQAQLDQFAVHGSVDS